MEGLTRRQQPFPEVELDTGRGDACPLAEFLELHVPLLLRQTASRLDSSRGANYLDVLYRIVLLS
jgi:hypothetical protein